MKMFSSISLVLFAFLVSFLSAEEKPVSPAVKSHVDLVYARHGDREMKLDLYVPDQGEGPFPIIVWIHGGGVI